MRRPALRSLRRVLVVVALLGVVVAVDVVADRTRKLYDLTSEDTLTLTPETKSIVKQFRGGRVKVNVFLRRNEPGRVDAATLLSRYRRVNRRVTFEVLDPDEAPGEVRRLGIDPVAGGIAVSHRGAVERATTATEQDVTAAMARLLRGHAATVCYAAGHGEPAIDDQLPEGFSEAAGLLGDNGYTLRVIDLLAQPSVPSECQALMMVSPTAPLGPAEPVLSKWLAADGKLLFLADPVSSVDVGPLLKPYGLGIVRGIVYEGEPEAALPGDPTSPIVRRYSSANPIVRRLPPTYFPGVEEVTVDDPKGTGGLSVSRLADTSEISYLETEPLASQFDPARDRRGPITVAGAADLSRVEGSTVKRTRVAVVGDSDFASNAFVDQAGNSKLLVQAVDWLTLEEDLITLSSNLPSDRPLRLTRARERYAILLSAGLVPGFFLVAGGLVWALRRSR